MSSSPTDAAIATYGQCRRCRRVRKIGRAIIVDCAGSNPALGRVLYGPEGKLLSCRCGGFLAPQDYFNGGDRETQGAVGLSVPLLAPRATPDGFAARNPRLALTFTAQ